MSQEDLLWERPWVRFYRVSQSMARHETRQSAKWRGKKFIFWK